MRVKVSEGKTKDVSIFDVTPENYIVPDNEKHLFHCVIEIKKFDSETGKRLSIPRIQKFGKKGYENSIAEHLKKQGYTITVLHDPNEYMKEQAEAESVARAEREKAALEKAKAKAKAAEKEALKAEILAELKASGVIPSTPVKETKADAKAKAEAEAKAEGKK